MFYGGKISVRYQGKTMARDRETGKFIPQENSFKKLFNMKVTEEMYLWIKENGGSEFVRSLVQEAMDRETAPKQAA